MAKLISSRSCRESKTIRNRKRLTFAASVAALACTFQLQASAADTTATWTSETSDDWTGTSLWSTAPNFPNNGTPAGTNYQALINATGGTAYTVTLDSNLSVDGLTLNSPDATMDQTAGILSPGSLNITAGTYELDGGTISGGTVNTTGGTFINASTGTLDGTSTGGITLVGTLKQAFGATTSLQGLINDPDGFTFDSTSVGGPSIYNVTLAGDTELSGNSTTTFAGGVSSVLVDVINLAGNGTSRLTIDKGHTLIAKTSIQAFSSIALTNNGVLDADGAEPNIFGNRFNLQLNNAASNNAGTIEAINGGSIEFVSESDGVFTNTGTIHAIGGSSISNFSDSTFTNMGTVQTLGGSSMSFLTVASDATFINTGSVLADGTGSMLTIGGNFSNASSGMVTATNGATINFQNGDAGTPDTQGVPSSATLGSSFINSGAIALHNGTINATTGLDIGPGTLTGSGTINGNLTLDSDPSTLAFNIGGETQGADYDSLTINGMTILAGDLQLTLTNGFFPLPTDIFTVLNVDSDDTLTGSFLNVASGGRLETADGGGSFEVLYGTGDFANEIVLEDFQPSPVPEPTSIAIVGMSLTLLARRKRRV